MTYDSIGETLWEVTVEPMGRTGIAKVYGTWTYLVIAESMEQAIKRSSGAAAKLGAAVIRVQQASLRVIR